jgi:hypothetical protein
MVAVVLSARPVGQSGLPDRLKRRGKHMMRKLAAGSAFVVLQAGLAFGISGVAEAMPALGPGHVSCSFAGSGKINPKITPAGSNGGMKVSFDGKAFGCTGYSIVIGTTTYTVTAASVKGSGYFTGVTGSKCANFEGAIPVDHVGVIKMTVKWIMSPSLAVAPSKVKYTGTYSANAPVKLDLGSSATPATTTTVHGSFPLDGPTQNTLMNIAGAVCPTTIGPPFSFPSGTLSF